MKTQVVQLILYLLPATWSGKVLERVWNIENTMQCMSIDNKTLQCALQFYFPFWLDAVMSPLNIDSSITSCQFPHSNVSEGFVHVAMAERRAGC